jgi:hypothetical protein
LGKLKLEGVDNLTAALPQHCHGERLQGSPKPSGKGLLNYPDFPGMERVENEEDREGEVDIIFPPISSVAITIASCYWF